MAKSTLEAARTDEDLCRIVANREKSDTARRAATEAFESLYLRHAKRFLAFLAARVRPGDLEDVHQSIWQKAWQNLPDGFRGGNFRAWLFQIARNYLIDQSRKKRAEPLENEGNVADDQSPRPDQAAIDREHQEILRRCLERLTADAADLVRARLAGESYHEICKRIDIKPERAHKIFHQAKEQLQGCVEKAIS